MIKSIHILSNNKNFELQFVRDNLNQINIDYESILSKFKTSFDIEIEFEMKIKFFRNHDYTWVKVDKTLIANDFSPKILKLENGYYIQAIANQGIWEVNESNPKKLYWKINPNYSNPLTNYTGVTNNKVIAPANTTALNKLGFLLSKNGAVELSRSKIPFVSTICFTDHCDFDTADLLVKQRVFFKENNIITTKGFFLNHFSKREENASWQNDLEELKKWKDNRHELAYHSLSQSIKSEEKSFKDFSNFNPPFDILTWIDHGYQDYNLSMYKKSNLSNNQFEKIINSKKIKTFWNYIDSGTATEGVLNQLNRNDFCLQSFFNGIKSKPFKQKMALLIKNCIVHFYQDEKLIKAYSKLASNYKKVSKTKSIGDFYKFIKNVSNVFFPLLKLFLLWNSNKKKVYPLATYTPIFFDHTINETTYTIFQTIELLDFKSALNEKSIAKFINEKGLFIGHTYFAVPLEYHSGRIFNSNNIVDDLVGKNFKNIGAKIKNDEIWNPTLTELVLQWKDYKNCTFAINQNGEIIIENNSNSIPSRTISC